MAAMGSRPSSGGQNTPQPILVAQDLAKAYGARVALRSLSFSLQAGSVLGFLGPNGAGKTTSIRLLTTVMEPSAGRFEVDGIGSDNPVEIRRRIGVLPEALGFPKNSSAIDYLTYFGQLFGRRAADARRTGLQLLTEVGLQNRAGALIGTYSHGMRQRLGIARALVNDPRVVFLDEPTLGLDPRGQHELLGMIQRVARERGAGVVLSSHLLTEIEGVCDDVVILNAGEVVAKGSVAEVIGGAAGDGMRHQVMRVRVPAVLAATALRALAKAEGVGQATLADQTFGWITIEGADGSGGAAGEEQSSWNGALAALLEADIPIVAVEASQGRLRDVFLALTAEAIE